VGQRVGPLRTIGSRLTQARQQLLRGEHLAQVVERRNDGIETAVDRAREAAGNRDVRIAGGGATILEYVNAGLIDEFFIALSPVLFGSGVRLFEGVAAGRVALEQVRAEPSPRVTHLTYAVRAR